MTIDHGPLAEPPVTEPATPARTGIRAAAPGRTIRLFAVPAAIAIALAVVVAGGALPPGAAPAAPPGAGAALASPATSADVAAPTTPDPGPVLGRADAPVPLTHEVLGFLPYWMMDARTPDRLRYDLLSTVALFGVGISRTGALLTKTAGYRAYTGPTAARITDRAHAAGVRVVPTFQLFDKAKPARMRAFLGDTIAQDRFIHDALALMATRKADGAVLDFEPLPDDLAVSFATFADRFREAMRKRDRHAQLTATLHPTVRDATVATVARGVDRVFLMGYDYHWRGSQVAGPVAPLDGPGNDVRTTLARFVDAAGARKVLLGVPYFGYDWPVAFRGVGADVRTPASENGGAWSLEYGAALDFLKQHPTVDPQWDPVSKSPYFVYRDTGGETYREVWYEDRRSLAAKYALAKASGVAGVGIWALGMDEGRTELWALLRSTFGKR